MESGNSMDCKPPSDEVSSPGPAAAGTDDDDAASSPPAVAAAARPYYECVFCKRGFTTAQALGGHMNIHRRDRARPGARDAQAMASPASASASRPAECFHGPYTTAVPYRDYLPYPLPPVLPATGFAMYYPAAPASARVSAEGEASPSSPRELTLFGAADELHLGLGFHGHGGRPRAPEDAERHGGEPEREVDLELRLGRRPRH